MKIILKILLPIVLLTLVGCNSVKYIQNNTDPYVVSSWREEFEPAFGIKYQRPEDSTIDGNGEVIAIKRNDSYLFSIVTLNSHHTKYSKPYPAEKMDWNYFLSLQPDKFEEVNNKEDLSWDQYHSIKDTFTPNKTVNGIPMYIEANYGKLFFYYSDLGKNYFYYRAHFFIQDGLNYIRVTLPINIPGDLLQDNNQEEIIKILNSDILPSQIQKQKELFNDIISRISIQEKFDNKNTNTTTISGIDSSNWQTYFNDKYGFNFKYPKDWILNELDNNISVRSKETTDSAYTNAFTVKITNKNLDSLKTEIENSDIIDGNKSLAKFQDNILETNINNYQTKIGTHSTAIGLNAKYYYINISNDTALYFEFLDPEQTNANDLVEDVINTLQ